MKHKKQILNSFRPIKLKTFNIKFKKQVLNSFTFKGKKKISLNFKFNLKYKISSCRPLRIKAWMINIKFSKAMRE